MQNTDSREQEWIAAAQAGDAAAFEALVLHYRPQAVRFAASLIHDAFHAEDIAQESFSKVYWHLADFKTGTSFKSWLFTIVRNRCIDHMRSKKPVLELDEAFFLAGGDEPEPALMDKEEWEAFKAQWGALPGDARTALYLFASEGMGYEQIGRVMGKSTSQIKMLLHRTRKKLRVQKAAGKTQHERGARE